MPFVANWIHLVWAVKNREPLLTDTLRPTIFAHIRANALRKELPIDHLNGWHNHVHALFQLPSTVALAYAVKLFKGESSHWINAEGLVEGFAWQTEYWAASVSPRAVAEVRAYTKTGSPSPYHLI
ncbi:MAG: transposase [Hymenobacteraceae bacterium]|nr:transposase [Hymenobacteraceae bacterium]